MEKQEDIFLSIVNNFQDKIFRLCWSYANNKTDCEDLVQEIYIKIWRNLKSFNNVSKIETWIYRIAVNTCIDFFRKNKRGNLYSFEKITSVKSLNHEITIEDSFIESEKLQQLHFCIQKLNEIEKLIIALYLEDIKYSEIAEIIGLTEKNISVRISRIKEKIKKSYDEKI
jgi:RNA polymerase sigma-70 factor (ECF subfamily)